MSYSPMFNDFLAVYEDKLNDVINKINRLCDIDGFTEHFDVFGKLSKEQWYTFIEDWIRVRSKLTHPMDIEFFAPSHIPVSEKVFEFFVDLDKAELQVFGHGYYTILDKCWYHYIMTESLDEFLNNSPEQTNFAEFKTAVTRRDVQCYSLCHERAGG